MVTAKLFITAKGINGKLLNALQNPVFCEGHSSPTECNMVPLRLMLLLTLTAVILLALWRIPFHV